MSATLLERAANLDRRWIFLAMGLSIAIPVFLPGGVPFKVSPMVRALHSEIESLPPGSRVFFGVDYDPASMPELEPFSRAVLRQLLSRRARIVIQTTWDKAPPIIEALIAEIIEGEYNRHRGPFAGRHDPPYVYGRDYAYFGFKEGKEIVIAGMGQNFRQIYPVDAKGRPIGDLPIMDGVTSLRDFRLLVESSAGFPGAKEYVQQVVTRYNLRFACATTAVSTTELSPYYPRQMFALVGGMRGSAEYESLVRRPGLATKGLNVLTFGHVLVIAAIVLGNVIHFAQRRREGAAK